MEFLANLWPPLATALGLAAGYWIGSRRSRTEDKSTIAYLENLFEKVRQTHRDERGPIPPQLGLDPRHRYYHIRTHDGGKTWYAVVEDFVNGHWQEVLRPPDDAWPGLVKNLQERGLHRRPAVAQWEAEAASRTASLSF